MIAAVVVAFSMAAAGADRMPATFAENHRLAEMYAAEGKISTAIPYFERARKLDPGNYVNSYDLALAYLKVGAVGKARAQVAGMIARADKPELHNLLGVIEEKAGNIEPAAREYQAAAQADPSEKHVFDFANCLLHYNAADRAVQIFNYGVEKYPTSARMRIGLGVAHYALGSYDDAVEALCRAVDLDPADTRAIYFLGKMYDISPTMAGEVTTRLARLVKAYPNNAAANYFYALSLWKTPARDGSPEAQRRAEMHLKKAILVDPKMADAHFQLGILYEEQQNLPAAVMEYERAVRLSANTETFHYRLGVAYKRSGQDAKAAEQFRIYRDLHGRTQAK